MRTVRVLGVAAGTGGPGEHLRVVGLAEFSLSLAVQVALDEKTKIRQGAAELFGEKSAVVLVCAP